MFIAAISVPFAMVYPPLGPDCCLCTIRASATLQSRVGNPHEYIGGAYLVLGDLPKAKEHLAVLDKRVEPTSTPSP